MRKLALAVLVSLPMATFALERPARAHADELQPPPPVPSDPNAQPPQKSAQQADLDRSKSEDSGLGLEWVWLNADVGFSSIDFKSFSESQLALTDTSKSGLMYGFGAGLRLLFLTIGARVRNHTAFNLWQINGEIGLHLFRVLRIDPYLAFRGGYDTVGTLSQSVNSAAAPSTQTDATVHGWNLGGALGLDFYFTSLFSIGAEAAGDFLFLKRPPATLPSSVSTLPQAQQDAIKSQPLYQQSGSSVGFGYGLSAHVGIHF
jgi:hypothetical protein